MQMAATLKDQGFRFVYRNRDGMLDYQWTHPAELQPTDHDCTDMDDDEFEAFVRTHAASAVSVAAGRVANELNLYRDDDQFSRDLRTLVAATR
jgi:hypothetical protein